MKKLLFVALLAGLAGSASAIDHGWAGNKAVEWATGGDGLTWGSTGNWHNETDFSTLPGTQDNARITPSLYAIHSITQMPTLNTAVNVGGLFMGLDNLTHVPTASLTVSATGSLQTNADDGYNDGIQIGWYSDASLTVAGTVDSAGGWTVLGAGDAGNGYGDATITVMGSGYYKTSNLSFNINTTNHIQIDGGTVETHGIANLHLANQTIDIRGGTFLFHSTDPNWLSWMKDNEFGLTGYGRAANLVGSHDGNTWTVTAQRPATIAHWRFEEGIDGVKHADDLDNFYRDSSENGNHLSSWWDGARPTATDDRPFAFVPQTGAENTLALDFTPAQDIGTFEPPHATGAKMVNTYMFNNGWTVECTFKLRSLYWEVLVGKEGKRGDLGGAVGSEAPFWFKVLDATKHLEVLVIDDNDTYHTVGTLAPLQVDKWYSVAATYDNAALKLYLKGEGAGGYVLQGAVGFTDGVALGGFNNPWTIGRGMWDGEAADFINGIVDEVRITDGVLDPAEFLNNDGDGDSNGMADAWEVQNLGGTGSDPYFDSDSDGLDDFTEYAFGGDPNVDDAAAIYPTVEWHENGDITYIYNRRLDATANTLAYDLVYKTNLLDLVWFPSDGLWETNTGSFNTEAESVSNFIPFSVYADTYSEAFVKLLVEDTWKSSVFLQVKNLSPAEGAVIEAADGILEWNAVSGAVSYEIYFGNNEAAVAAGDAGVLVATQSGTAFDATALVAAYDEYYWRIVPVGSNPDTVFMPSPVWSFEQTVPAELGRGHRILLKRGFLSAALVFPGDFGFAGGSANNNLNWATWYDSRFNTVCTHSGWIDLLTGPYDTVGPQDVYYWRWSEGQSDLLNGTGNGSISWQEEKFFGTNNLVALQAADEEDLNDTGWRNAIKAAFDRWKIQWPNTLVYTTQNGPDNEGGIRSFQEYAKPDMSFMFTYEFKDGGGDIHNMWKSCRDFREWGKQGIGPVDYAEPIPYGMYYQTMNIENNRHVGQSELCLGMFGPVTFGYKTINAFVYARNSAVAPENTIRAELFEDGGDSVRWALFDVAVENNRQILLMGDSLVRLSSEAVYDVNVSGQITDWTSGAIPNLTGISATPVGTYASGTDEVLIGHFRPLHEAFDGSGYSNQDYFMVMNADHNVDDTAADYAQTITLTIGGGITALESINLTTGLVETLPVTGGTVAITLDGGRGKLFKFQTGAPFVGFYNGE